MYCREYYELKQLFAEPFYTVLEIRAHILAPHKGHRGLLFTTPRSSLYDTSFTEGHRGHRGLLFTTRASSRDTRDLRTFRPSRVFQPSITSGLVSQPSGPQETRVYQLSRGPVFSRAQLKNLGIYYRQSEYPSLLVDKRHRISNTRDTTSVSFGRSVQLDELADPVLQIHGLTTLNRCSQSPNST